MNPWLYAALCVVVPVAWGLGVVWIGGILERRFGRKPTEASTLAQDDQV